MINEINRIGKFIEKQGFKENIYNKSDSYELFDWGRYTKGYENGNNKCILIGNNNGSKISLNIACSDKLKDQMELQIKILETINGGSYQYESYKKIGGVYIDRVDRNFLHVRGDWLEMIFKRNGDSFEQIYEGNS